MQQRIMKKHAGKQLEKDAEDAHVNSMSKEVLEKGIKAVMKADMATDSMMGLEKIIKIA